MFKLTTVFSNIKMKT